MDIENIALVTVTDSKYLQGTIVLLYSFLKNNPEYNGDIIVIESDLTYDEKSKLMRFPKLHIEQPSEMLLKQISILANYWEVAKVKQKQFFSLEAFRFSSYSKLLFLDSDMLCIGNVMDLFRMNHEFPLVAVSDILEHKNQLRDKLTFLPCSKNQQMKDRSYFKSFNSGFILIDRSKLQDSCYLELVKHMNPIIFSKNKTRLSDQFLLNHYFHNNVNFVSSGYNYLLNINSHPFQDIKEIKNNSDIRMVHYLEMIKPWATTIEDQSFISLWKEYYNEANEK